MNTKCGHSQITASCKHCQALQRHWYGKLEALAFKDAEDFSKPSRPLNVWHGMKFKKLSLISRVVTESYYDSASSLLHTFPFKNETERRIWELHCNGMSKRKIESLIKDMGKPVRREQIGNIIIKISREIK